MWCLDCLSNQNVGLAPQNVIVVTKGISNEDTLGSARSNPPPPPNFSDFFENWWKWVEWKRNEKEGGGGLPVNFLGGLRNFWVGLVAIFLRGFGKYSGGRLKIFRGLWNFQGMRNFQWLVEKFQRGGGEIFSGGGVRFFRGGGLWLFRRSWDFSGGVEKFQIGLGYFEVGSSGSSGSYKLTFYRGLKIFQSIKIINRELSFLSECSRSFMVGGLGVW